MLGPTIWLALAFVALSAVRVAWVILLQPKPMIGRTPVDSVSRAKVIRWADDRPDAGPEAEPEAEPEEDAR